MAIVVQYQCLECGVTGTTAVGSGQQAPTECGECKQKRADRERREHFSGLDGLTLEERIRRIEEWIYDYKVPIPLSEMRF